MASGEGRAGVTSVLMESLGASDAPRAIGLDDGFLKGRLGRTRLGENEGYILPAVNMTDVILSQTVQ